MINICDYAEKKLGIDPDSAEMIRVVAQAVELSGLAKENLEDPIELEILVNDDSTEQDSVYQEEAERHTAEDSLKEAKFHDFQEAIVENWGVRPYGDETKIYIKDINYDGNKVVFISLTENEKKGMTLEEIKSLDLGNKKNFGIIIEDEEENYLVLVDDEGVFYYEKFF